MVFFTCDGCGETLKKNQVDAHAGRCRRCDSVSCVDCSIAFYGGTFGVLMYVRRSVVKQFHSSDEETFRSRFWQFMPWEYQFVLIKL